jgi:preprotein translocase subunit SecA
MLPLVEKINSFEDKIKSLSDDELRAKTSEFKQRLKGKEDLDDLLPEAFAVVRETAVRTMGMRPFDVQLMGGIVLHQGKIAEMKTGEGKTLTSTLAMYLNALEGKGVHVVTVNDYLAKRDCEWMSPIFTFLGLTSGFVQNMMPHDKRAEAYSKDITYGTNNEFGFDYLRDNMVEHKSLKVQRKLNFAIVDEVDSILIDEARTPLIISGPSEESIDKYYVIDKFIPRLSPASKGEDGKWLEDSGDYQVEEKEHSAILTQSGIDKMEKLLKVDNLYNPKNMELVHHINQALRAHTLYKKDKDYIVDNGEVIIIDEFTGRKMFGRRYSDGLHQAIEAKERVTIEQESQTLATITIQNYFRMYKKLSGMTGTAETEAEEFYKIYKLDVSVIPTNKEMIRKDQGDKIYSSHKEKLGAIIDEIERLYKKAQPVLVGTASVEKSEELAKLLTRKRIPHNVLNAKNHEKEAQIVASAGKLRAVTIATNMAGRGTDIVLGGNPEHIAHSRVGYDAPLEEFKTIFEEEKLRCKDEKTKVLELGGLYVLGTERHESRRIDNQLRGRSGRQGDPGESRFYLSLEDDLMRLFGSDRLKPLMQRLGLKDGQEIEHKWISKAIENAQRRVEGRNFEIRKHLLEYDDVMNRQRETIYSLRNEALEEADLKDKISLYIEDAITELVEMNTVRNSIEDYEYNSIKELVFHKFGINLDDYLNDASKYSKEELRNGIVDALRKSYAKKEENVGSDVMRQFECFIVLSIIDDKWKDHLLSIDSVREGIQFVSYAEKNPLTEYKREASNLFETMQLNLKEDIVELLFRAEIAPADFEFDDYNMLDEYDTLKDEFNAYGDNASGPIRKGSPKRKSKGQIIKHERIGRNDPCPCGSGKKYKQCCGK